MSYTRMKRGTDDASAAHASRETGASLRIGPADDAFEREADRVATHVSHLPWNTMRATFDDPSGPVPIRHAARTLSRTQRSRDNRFPDRRFRVPKTVDMKTLFASGDVPESTLKDRIQVALSRMASEKRLKSSDSVSDLIKKIFPSPGVFDESEYEKAVDVTDRSKVYESVLDAETTVKATDKPKLKTTMKDASDLITASESDTANLASVFGSKKNEAKQVYTSAKSALDSATSTMDATISTDYNLDDPEVGLGGWASFADKKVHFMPQVVKVANEKEAKSTIIHEAAHLGTATVQDKGYYGSSGFEAMSEADKITNAAHFEEVPRRQMNISRYTKPSGGFIDFTPGTSASGAPVTFEDEGKRKADEYFRKAWDKAVDVDEFLRDIRKDELGGSTTSFAAHKARLLELSKLLHLTIHEQAPTKASVNQVDIVLAEGVAHAMRGLKRVAAKSSVSKTMPLTLPPVGSGPKLLGPKKVDPGLELKPIPSLSFTPPIVTTDDAAEKIIKDTIILEGPLVGTYDDDRKLLDWLVREYKKPL